MIEKKLRKIIEQITLNILYAKREKIYPAYVSEHNSNGEEEVILLTIPSGEKIWHYLAVKKLSALLRIITSKYNSDFYCLHCLHYFRKTNLKIKGYVEVKIFVM